LKNSSLPLADECRYLILKIIEQAVRDYLALENNSAPIDRFYYETACRFLFDNDYTIDYGGVERNLQGLLNILDIDISWFRERVVKLKDIKIREQERRRNNNVELFSEEFEWD